MFWCWGFLKDGFFKVFVKIIVLKTKKKTEESFLKTVGKIHGNIFLGNFVKACRSIFFVFVFAYESVETGLLFCTAIHQNQPQRCLLKKNFCQNFKNLFICVITFCQRSSKLSQNLLIMTFYSNFIASFYYSIWKRKGENRKDKSIHWKISAEKLLWNI